MRIDARYHFVPKIYWIWLSRYSLALSDLKILILELK